MVIETDHREEDRNEARMDASSTLAGSTLGRRKGHDYLKRRFECSYRSECSTQLSRHLRCDAPGLPIFFGAIAKSGKAKDCKSFILGSNPSGAFGAVV